MDRSEFMSKAYQALQSFETHWNRGQRGPKPEQWPNELSEGDWWDQLFIHLEGEAPSDYRIEDFLGV